jgi:manganese/zinc/iron transport system permease protein
MSAGQAAILTAVLIAGACGLTGVFLVLRKMSMMADAITHSVLPGLVAAYVFAHGPNLAAGLVGAAAAGLITVTLVELLTKSRSMKEDSAIGLVFPTLFALGVLIVSRQYSDLHIDTDSILYGQLELAVLDKVKIGETVIGRTSVITAAGLLLINIVFLGLFYKELKITTFDPDHAQCLGFRPARVHYGLMALTAVTAVGAFSAVGAVLSTALIVIPAAAALMMSNRLPAVIAGALAIGAASAWGGVTLARINDLSTAGMITLVLGGFFALAVFVSPTKGLAALARRRAGQSRRFAAEMLAVHLLTHEGTVEEPIESAYAHLLDELDWTSEYADMAVEEAVKREAITVAESRLFLTDVGRAWAEDLSSQKRFAMSPPR